MSAAVEQPAVGLPDVPAVLAQERGENFTVAGRLLPRAVRADFRALYGYARLVDDAGDEIEGDRLAALDWIEQDLDRAFAGRARHPLLRALEPAIERHALPRAELVALIDANRMDQRVSRYETFADLRASCALSADPVGRLVLRVLGAATPERIALSDDVCTGLQIVEHCQDVAEDYARGRVYLPQEDLRRFGVSEDELRGPVAGGTASPALRDLIAFECDRAQELLRAGVPLARSLHGRARFAIAAFTAGGRAALGAIAASRNDVLAGPPKASKARRAAALVRTLTEVAR
ncbi:MAG TPA: squalene synthase HpnC [Solirubrobacteraceae bacterium]|nr:squalene synthase HpnC [Solirubrobacteraceae bacterium]